MAVTYYRPLTGLRVRKSEATAAYRTFHVEFPVTDSGSVGEDVTITVAKAGGTLAVPITHRYVAMTTGGVEALTLADGSPGQLLTLSLVVDGGDGTLTPTTKSGFATVVFADIGDTITLEFVNAAVGWILIGTLGVAAPPVITL